MSGQRYNCAKDSVLDVCRRYLSFRGDIEDGVDRDILKLRIKALEDSRYTLVVVGEVKAGKSTFINALLGKRILPTDILQSSSAIVEICKSDKKYMQVRYADGHDERVEDDEASERLRQIGAIQDQYRDIPTTLIDAYIAEGRIKPDHPLPIVDLEAESDMRLEDKKSLIQEYVKSRPLAEIPKQITYGFPLKYAFDGLRLVDSPGVNAIGGVQNATYGYIQEANAVLFVHSVEHAVESGSFHKFVDGVVSDRIRRGSLFLILTKCGDKSEIEIEEKVGQARSTYEEKLDPHRVLHTDSMLKIISDEVQSHDSVASLEKYYREQKQILEEKYRHEKRQETRDEAVNFHTKWKLLNFILGENSLDRDSDPKTVREVLLKNSNFEEIERSIDEFSDRAPRLQLTELLDSVQSGYRNQANIHDQNLDAWKKKRKSPQTFEQDISRIQKLLDDSLLSVEVFSENVKKEHTGLNTSYQEQLGRIKSRCLKGIESAVSASSLDTARKALTDFQDAIRSLGDDITKQIRDEFEVEMKRLEGKFKAEHSITIPTVDIAGLVAKVKKTSYREIDVPRSPKGAWEWIQKILSLGRKEFKEKKTVYDAKMHVSGLDLPARRAVDKLSGEFPGLVGKLIDNFVNIFRKDMGTLIAERKEMLEEIKTRKVDNEEIMKNIAAATQKKKDIDAQMAQIDDMLGELRWAVEPRLASQQT